MVLLAPTAMILGAAVAVPALLALYILKLRRRPVRVTSIRHWPVASQDVQANVPFRWLRPSWLLLLHACIVALLLLSLGRPALTGSLPIGRRVVVVLDTSASMDARESPGGPTRLELARTRASGLIRDDRNSPPTEFAVIASAGEASLLTSRTTSHRAALDAISLAVQTDQPGDLGAALRLAASLSTDALEELPSQVIVLTDGCFTPADTIPAGLSVRYDAVVPTDRTPVNIGITACAAARSRSDPQRVDLLVDLVSTNRESASTILTVMLGGAVAERVGVTIPPGPAGTATVRLSVVAPKGGLLRAVLPEGDALASDNEAGVVVPAPAPPSILLVSPEGPGERMPLATALLADVISELGARRFDHVTLAEYQPPAARDAGPTIVVFDRCAPARLPACGTLMLGAVPREELSLQTTEPGEVGPLYWDRRHPVLRLVTLDPVVIGPSPTMTLPEHGPWRSLVRCTRGTLVAAHDEPPRRLVMAFGLSDSNWPVQTGFPVLLASAIDYLVGVDPAASWAAPRTTDPFAIPARPGQALELSGPTAVTAHAPASDAVARAKAPLRAGIYVNPQGIAYPRSLLSVGESSLQITQHQVPASSGPARGEAEHQPREVWHWCLIGALVLLAVDWLAYATQARA